MKKVIKLTLVGLVPILLILEGMFFAHQTVKISNLAGEETRKVQLALVIDSFHSYYHRWPCTPGPLEQDALEELGGFSLAQINTQHINFFKKNKCSMAMDTFDVAGRPFSFMPVDDSLGTCTIEVNPHFPHFNPFDFLSND